MENIEIIISLVFTQLNEKLSGKINNNTVTKMVRNDKLC